MIRNSLLAAATLITAVACAPTSGAPTAPVTITYDTIPWCADSSGHSVIYPCRWDSRERPPSPAWDRRATRIAIWIPREIGCAWLFARVRTPEVSPPRGNWSCYYAPVPEDAPEVLEVTVS